MTQRLEESESLSIKAMNELNEKEKNSIARKANRRKRAGG